MFTVEAEVGKIRLQQNLKDVLEEHGFGICKDTSVVYHKVSETRIRWR